MKAALGSVVLLVLMLVGAGRMQAQGEVYVVMHIDIGRPPAAGGSAAAGILRQWAVQTKKEPGCVRFEVLQQSDRDNHFAVVGVWKDQKAFDEHEAAAHTIKFRNDIQPLLGSPFDERLHHLLQ